MNVAFIVRLAVDALAEGRLAGRVEVVETGQRVPFDTATALVAFLLECGRDQAIVLAGDA